MTTAPATPASIKFTEEFLMQWALHKKLQPTPDEILEFEKENSKYDHDCAKSKAVPAAFDEDIKPGDIRLLSQPDTTCYVLVVTIEDDNTIIVPFSKFSAPATCDEFMLRPGNPLAVLQLWNVRSLHATLLRGSWLVDRLSNDELSTAAEAVLKVLTGDGEVPDFADRIGTEIIRPDDPRLDYREEELDKFAELDAANFELVQQLDE